MMTAKDFLKNTLKVGDKVAFISSRSKWLETGTIIKLNAKQATIRREGYENSEFYNIIGFGKVCKHYNQIVKAICEQE